VILSDLALSALYFAGMCVSLLLMKVFWRAITVNGKATRVSQDDSGIFIEHGMKADGSGKVYDDKRLSKQAMRNL